MDHQTFDKTKNLMDEISHLQFQLEQIERVLKEDEQPYRIQLAFSGIGDVYLDGPRKGNEIQPMLKRKWFERFLTELKQNYELRLKELKGDLQNISSPNDDLIHSVKELLRTLPEEPKNQTILGIKQRAEKALKNYGG